MRIPMILLVMVLTLTVVSASSFGYDTDESDSIDTSTNYYNESVNVTTTDCGSDFVQEIDNATGVVTCASAGLDTTWLVNWTAYNTTWSSGGDGSWLANWTAYNTTWSTDLNTNAETECSGAEYLAGNGTCTTDLTGSADATWLANWTAYNTTWSTDLNTWDASWLANWTAYNTTWSTDTNTDAESKCAGALYLAGNGTCTTDLTGSADATWLTNWTAYNTTWSLDTDTFVANYTDFLNKVDWVDVNNKTILLDGIGDPAGNTTFTMSNKLLAFRYTTPTPSGDFGGAFEVEGTGAFKGDLVHIHQHSGNPTSVNLLKLEADDADVLPLKIIGISGLVANFTGGNLWVRDNITTLEYFIGNGSQLTDVIAVETLWNANYSDFLNKVEWEDVNNGTITGTDATWLANWTAYNTTWSTDTIDTTWLVNWTAYNTTWSADTNTNAETECSGAEYLAGNGTCTIELGGAYEDGWINDTIWTTLSNGTVVLATTLNNGSYVNTNLVAWSSVNNGTIFDVNKVEWLNVNNGTITGNANSVLWGDVNNGTILDVNKVEWADVGNGTLTTVNAIWTTMSNGTVVLATVLNNGSYVNTHSIAWADANNGTILDVNKIEWADANNGTILDVNKVFWLNVNNGTITGNANAVLWGAVNNGTILDPNKVEWADTGNGTLATEDSIWTNVNNGTITDVNKVFWLNVNNGTIDNPDKVDWSDVGNSTLRLGSNHTFTEGNANITAGNVSLTERVKLAVDPNACSNMVSGEMCRNATGVFIKG